MLNNNFIKRKYIQLVEINTEFISLILLAVVSTVFQCVFIHSIVVAIVFVLSLFPGCVTSIAIIFLEIIQFYLDLSCQKNKNPLNFEKLNCT